MTWLIIGVVLLAAFGPILWLVPTRKDRRLAQVRKAAREGGLVVELQQIPLTNPSAAQRVSAGGALRNPVVDCAVYRFPLERKLRHLPPWRLLKLDGAEEGPFPDWVFNPAQSALEPAARSYLSRMLALVPPVFSGLPSDVIGLEIGVRNLSVCWLEGPGSGVEEVARIISTLASLQARFEGLEAAISGELENEES